MHPEMNLPNESIGFRTHDKGTETLVDIYVVGKQKVTTHDYFLDGIKRSDKETFIFQYTLSGEGAVSIQGKVQQVQEGQAFMVEVPSEHCYYLPSHSNEWEFIFLTLKGPAAASCWRDITGKFGAILTIPLDSQLIKHVFKVYELACKKDLIDNYFASYQAYGFIMECHRYFKQFKQKENLPEYIIQASNYIKMHFAEPLSIEDIAASVNLSKYYFIKRFGETMNMTPGQYITKIRLEQAIHLLRNTELTIKDIAVKVGYGDDNYFNKAFRKVVGTSPGEFRKNKQLPFDRLIIQ